MHQGSNLIGRIAQWAIMGLGVLFTIMIFAGSDAGIDGGLWITYIALGIAAIATLGFSLQGLTKKSLIGLGAFLALFVVAYVLDGGTVRPGWNVTESTSKWIGAGLILMYIALIGAICMILYGEITRMFK
ncbi:MAG: hypothetical protein H6591_00115 [Flavobacteriales bacterium]|nr:hypothetical protein [Flavobacteriales bacterium]